MKLLILIALFNLNLQSIELNPIDCSKDETNCNGNPTFFLYKSLKHFFFFKLKQCFILECGKTFFKPDLHITSGVVAVPHSWPSIAYIQFSYRLDTEINTETYTSNCTGVLIDHNTVLTPAHCIPTKAKFRHNGQLYTIGVSLNSHYPTLESMLSVYLGVQDYTELAGDIIQFPIVRKGVKSVVKVN